MSDITIEELRDGTVVYDLEDGGMREVGLGTFVVSGNLEHGTQILEIHQNYSLGGGAFRTRDLLVQATAIPMIRLHPDQSVARFLLNIP